MPLILELASRNFCKTPQDVLRHWRDNDDFVVLGGRGWKWNYRVIDRETLQKEEPDSEEYVRLVYGSTRKSGVHVKIHEEEPE